jgi:methionyl-tRNA formyltransferase
MLDGADLLVNTIEKFKNGDIAPEHQDDEKSCYASMLSKEIAKINWSESSQKIKDLIRGLNPWPGAYTEYDNDIMKIFEADVMNSKTDKQQGYILKVSKDGIEVATGDGVLLIKTIQFPGGKPLKVEEYIKGHTIKEGVLLN